MSDVDTVKHINGNAPMGYFTRPQTGNTKYVRILHVISICPNGSTPYLHLLTPSLSVATYTASLRTLSISCKQNRNGKGTVMHLGGYLIPAWMQISRTLNFCKYARTKWPLNSITEKFLSQNSHMSWWFWKGIKILILQIAKNWKLDFYDCGTGHMTNISELELCFRGL